MPQHTANPHRAIRHWLADWHAAGVTRVKAVDVSAAFNAVRDALVASEAPVTERALSEPNGGESVPQLVENLVPESNHAMSREERESHLSAVAERVAQCVRCAELAETRTQTVFGVGNPQADVMFVGEAPGADEDAQGEPFVGRAGQLLNKIIAACGWQREDIYICNILRCRPPGNRNPTPQEAADCREYLDAQVRIVDPDYIVCWGSVAAHNLLDETRAIGKLREKWFNYGSAKVMCTYHPSYLLRNPAAKKPVWEDMQRLLKEMGLEPPAN